MPSPTDPSETALIRVWTHGDEAVGRVTFAGPDDATPQAETLAGRAEIIEWVNDWLKRIGDADATQK